jgi:acyl-coenzyme A synthetase/AMP-(fatty) acid ligase
MQELLLPEILRLHGRWRAAHPAIVSDAETLDWASFDQRTEQVANGLRAGCGDGARIGVVMNNDVATVEVLVGAMKAGAIVAPLNTTISDDAIAAMLADAGAEALIVSSEHATRIDARALRRASLRLVTGQSPGWDSYEDWRARQSIALNSARLKRDDLCNIIYSSGTTGQPKGIAHTHGARLDWTHDLAHALRYHSGARLFDRDWALLEHHLGGHVADFDARRDARFAARVRCRGRVGDDCT